MEIATDYGKAYSPVYIETEMMYAFYGRLKDPAGPGLIKFNMDINDGYSYDNNTGIFKANRTGFYSFYITARTRTDRYTTMELRRNGVRVGSITNDLLPENSWEVEDGANNIVLSLNYGDVITVHANGTLQAGTMMSGFSLRTLLETPPVVLYATMTEGKLVEANSFLHIDYDNVHINTAQTFEGNTNFTVPSDGFYVVTVTNSFLDSAIHASLISSVIKMLRYSQLTVPSRTSSSFTFIARFNESDVIQNQLFSLYEAHLSNETSISIFKYFEIDEINVSAVTVRQTPLHKYCETEFCNPLANGLKIEDMGSDFDIKTGVFTVPRWDVYVISANFFGTQVDTVFEIVVNGKVLDSVLVDGPANDYFVNDSKMVVVKRLLRGDKVELRMKGRSFFYTIMSIWTLTA
ncbi:uncharacterized protein LOC125676238 isoform X2 [Ostrea edulis]|nr:uncharacterized protein LOC125676238 isoform X2 [Ostrea edulis]